MSVSSLSVCFKYCLPSQICIVTFPFIADLSCKSRSFALPDSFPFATISEKRFDIVLSLQLKKAAISVIVQNLSANFLTSSALIFSSEFLFGLFHGG